MSVPSGINSSMKRRGSMFDASLARLNPVGSSLCTFQEDPTSELFLMKKFSVRYQNTYKVDPDKKFEPGKVQAILEQVLMDKLEDVEYNSVISRELSKQISDKILKILKTLGYNRHKLVVLVNIGQLKDQGTRVSSRCLMDTKRDSWAGALYEGKTLWATATVYGIYYE
uniref:Dynein light chain n=1 Tax=Ciona intestinalis TaxID=7719 RepID=Q8T894_CIOIN|nr:dynein light chain [Ciona intestinalis]XP_009858519.1 dynein light chain isoform X1 [Ciona intestinalis]BAB85847.1 dynein light chain [Ciona intestinalis]|eukprot:NP_001027637.1 dynein light chain [Ciona intestinalis]